MYKSGIDLQVALNCDECSAEYSEPNEEQHKRTLCYGMVMSL